MAFADLAAEGLVELPVVPDDRVQNAHMYYLLLPTLEDRTSFISFLKEGGVQAAFITCLCTARQQESGSDCSTAKTCTRQK